MTDRIQTTFRIPAELRRRLRVQAAIDDIEMTEIIIRALDNEVSRLEATRG